MLIGRVQAILGRGLGFIAPSTRSDRAHGAAETTRVTTGTIKVIRDRGFGYIARDNNGDRADLFFHRSAVAGDGFALLREGQHVSFDEEPDPRDRNRQRAVNVQPTGDTGA